MVITWSQLYREVCARLDSTFEAGQLFAHCTGLLPHQLPHLGMQPATEPSAHQLLELCARRLAGEPLQYLLGEWEFYGLPFSVGDGVLIPRQDTELLVDMALQAAGALSQDEPVTVLDLCSGSGAVAVALACNLPGAHITAVELSDAAYEYLVRNIARNQAMVVPVHSDIFAYTPPGVVDLITANPPYIPSGELAGLQVEVQQEPLLALDGGPDGLEFYRGIAAYYQRFLAPGGAICLEVGMGQAASVAHILEEQEYKKITLHKDLSGTNRVVQAHG